MAYPNTEDGFVMIALELGAALAMARLTTAEQVVAWEVVAQTFGPSKAGTATLSASELAKRTGLDRAFLAKGIASLVASNMLAKVKDGYKLQKNYDRWDRTSHKETEEQAKARREYAKGAIKAARIRNQDASSGCVNTDTPCENACVNTDTPPVSILTQTCVNTDTPILLEELESLEKCCVAVAVEDAQQHGEPEAEPVASIPLPAADRHAEEDRLAAWVKAHVMATSGSHGRPNDEGWGIDAALQAVGLLQSGLPALAIREAVIKAMSLDQMKPIRYARYVPTTAAGMAATLAAKSEPVKFEPSRSAPRLSPAQQRMQDQWDAFTEIERQEREGA